MGKIDSVNVLKKAPGQKEMLANGKYIIYPWWSRSEIARVQRINHEIEIQNIKMLGTPKPPSGPKPVIINVSLKYETGVLLADRFKNNTVATSDFIDKIILNELVKQNSENEKTTD